MQNEKITMKKKLQQQCCHFATIKSSNNIEKRTHTKDYAYKKILHGRNMQYVRKNVSTGFASPNNLANVAWQHFWQITSS